VACFQGLLDEIAFCDLRGPESKFPEERVVIGIWRCFFNSVSVARGTVKTLCWS
jgi:hypothetical protein